MVLQDIHIPPRQNLVQVCAVLTSSTHNLYNILVRFNTDQALNVLESSRHKKWANPLQQLSLYGIRNGGCEKQVWQVLYAVSWTFLRKRKHIPCYIIVQFLMFKYVIPCSVRPTWILLNRFWRTLGGVNLMRSFNQLDTNFLYAQPTTEKTCRLNEVGNIDQTTLIRLVIFYMQERKRKEIQTTKQLILYLGPLE